MTFDPLEDPLRFLAADDSEYDWAGSVRLDLDERYRRRQLPLLDTRPRPDLGPAELRDGEFWPPVRSIVVPLEDAAIHGAPDLIGFLDQLRETTLVDTVWWPGLAARADRMHATLVPNLGATPVPTAARAAPLTVHVRGPWVGRFNTGRIYLPVEIPDKADRVRLHDLRDRMGAAHRPLLAGYLQLRHDVTGKAYQQLRDIVAAYQNRVRVPVRIDCLHVTDTQDDLVLRSQVVAQLAIP